MVERFVNPYADYGFKKLFGTEQNADLLVSFLNSLISDNGDPIVSIKYKNVEHLGEINTMRDKWMCALYSLCYTDEQPPELQDEVFLKLFEEARLANFNEQELFAYQMSLKDLWDSYSTWKCANEEEQRNNPPSHWPFGRGTLRHPITFNLLQLSAMRDPNKDIMFSPIDEARRYVDNAAKTLKENAHLDKESNRYEDPKYVKAAGNYLWLAVLIALDAAFHVKASKKDGRVDVGDYKAAVAKRDLKLLKTVTEAYNILHLDMTYDGISHKDLCDLGFRLANDIINRCAAMLPIPH